MRKRIPAFIAAALFAVAATGCSAYNDERGKGDAPVANRKGDDSPAYVANMPDGFPNGSAKCLKGFAPWAFLVTTDRGLVMFQAPETCGGKSVPTMQMVLGN